MPVPDDTTLGGLMEILVRKTGKFELVGVQVVGDDTVPDYTVDNGAALLINKAIQWFDENTVHAGKAIVTTFTAAAEASELVITNILSIESIRDSSAQVYLTETTREWMIENYGEDLEAIDTDEDVLYWAWSKTDPETIVLAPRPSAETVFEVSGIYKLARLTTVSSSNWWTRNHSEKILFAAERLAFDLDLNPFTNSTIMRFLEEAKRAVLIPHIRKEIAFEGDVMKGASY